MLTVKWLYELIVVIYGLSVIGYFMDFVQPNQKVNRVAFWLLSMVWISQTIFLLLQILNRDHFPVLNVYDGLYFYAWVLVTFSLLLNKFFKVDFIVFFTNLIGFFVMMLHISATAQNHESDKITELVGEILIAHISLAILSYGFFTLSFIFSAMYLTQYRLLKEKRGYKWLMRLSNLETLDSLSFRAIFIGVPSLLISIILGLVWAYTSNSEFYWYDTKTIGSLLVLLVYMVYLFLRVVKNYQGRTIALFNVAAFLFLLVNFLLFSSLSSFHF
ncbi:cytochrome c biogenesis protein [Radiobacillus kanasensis]|uniref:cytochrome C assembly family protein n=1 Tax=Radiobacillus kanasensis TaxID=2844358 RepID=UPI001E287CB7|nr:cytochrome c biogenesis protein CcsA [Radiobacillus kanasensis]UFT97952.1 cytochrome c biogenesis protein [Radiobacillus kanasensis]